MARIVMKFGGTSVGDLDRIRNVARRVKAAHDDGHEVAVVVSAMSGETNRLVGLVSDAAALYDTREHDVVVRFCWYRLSFLPRSTTAFPCVLARESKTSRVYFEQTARQSGAYENERRPAFSRRVASRIAVLAHLRVATYIGKKTAERFPAETSD